MNGQSFVWGNSLISAKGDDEIYYLQDHLNSPVRLFGKNQEAALGFDEFGMPLGETSLNQPFGFTGYQLDGNGLQYAQARYYSPNLGRFSAEDPIRDKFNWYGYCGGNPVNFIDPRGLQDCPGDAGGTTAASQQPKGPQQLQPGQSIFQNPNHSVQRLNNPSPPSPPSPPPSPASINNINNLSNSSSVVIAPNNQGKPSIPVANYFVNNLQNNFNTQGQLMPGVAATNTAQMAHATTSFIANAVATEVSSTVNALVAEASMYANAILNSTTMSVHVGAGWGGSANLGSLEIDAKLSYSHVFSTGFGVPNALSHNESASAAFKLSMIEYLNTALGVHITGTVNPETGMMTDFKYGFGGKMGDFTDLYWTNKTHENNLPNVISFGTSFYKKLGGGFNIVFNVDEFRRQMGDC